jgi:APA family basic amino acid/polyamine antiporter
MSAGSTARTIGLPISFSIALKQVIGGGVIVLTGTAIGLTGAGAWLAYLMACAVVLIVSIPYAILGAARPETGALYRWPAIFIHPVAGFMGFWMVLGTHVALAAYAATFGVTLHALLPSIPARPAGVCCLVLVVGLNLLGTERSGRVNLAVVVLVASALAALAVAGLPTIDRRLLLPLLPHGWSGLLSAAALLTFPLSGATLVSELAGEMRRPARDVPVAILGATALAATIYIAVALVAASTPGLSAAPGLDTVARHVMGSAGAWAFGLCTGVVSMIGVMNTHMLWGSRSILMVCEDDWLPRRLARRNRFGAPVFPLCLLGLIGAVPIAAGLDVGDIIRLGGLGAGGSAVLSIACAPLNARRDPAAYASSPLAVPVVALLAAACLAIAVQIVTASLLWRSLTLRLELLWFAWMVAGVTIALVRQNRFRLQGG